MSAQAATYYELLGVSRRARPESVRSAYRRLAQRYHPDKMPGNARAEQVMAALNEAYAVLSDPQQRARYDEHMEPPRVRVTPTDDPGAAWPWYLILATVIFAAAAVGVSLYKNYVPGASSPAQPVKVVAR